MDYNSLESIERTFGSVAEYNRCRLEEDYYEEPSEEEIKRSRIAMQKYHKKVTKANGIPSLTAKMIAINIRAFAPRERDFSDGNEYYYRMQDYYRESKMSAMEKLAWLYGIEFSRSTNPYQVSKGSFAIQIEHEKYGMITKYSVSNLDFVSFCDLFRDAEHTGLSPTAFFVSTSGNLWIVSNVSLGILLVDFGKEIGK